MSKITIHNIKSKLIWNKASEFIIDWLKLYHNIGQKTLLLLSGGSATKLYPAVAEFIKTSELDFGYLVIGQVDERKFNSQQSTVNREDTNAYQIEKTGLWEACRLKNISYYLVSQEGTLEDAAEKYNRQMEEFFKDYTYKIGVLGIGEDAHTAGLLPGYQNVWNNNQFVVGYDIQPGQDKAMALSCLKTFRRRITATPFALKQLDQAVIVATGAKKKWAIEKVLDPGSLEDFDKYPAAVLQKIKKADLFTDFAV